MWLLVGLGNPDETHIGHRHNVGFMILDRILEDRDPYQNYRKKFQAKYCEIRVAGAKVALLKPQTYMNNSGISIGKAAEYYNIDPDRILIFHDELDIPPGQVKIKFSGGAAGHNGIKSAQAHLGTPDFWRVRIGIGHPGHKDRVSGYVLSDFSKSDQAQIDPVIRALVNNVDSLVTDGPQSYATRTQEALASSLNETAR